MAQTKTQDWLNCNIQPGKKVKQFYQAGNINNATLHIRALVDNEYVVIRQWSKSRQSWCYKVEHITMFELLYEKGYLQAT